MKAIIAFLLGLIVISYAGDSNEELSLDSSDEGAESMGGLSLNVYLNVGDANVPQIVIGYDESDKTYCLNLDAVFEIINFEATDEDGIKCNEDCDYDVVDSSLVSLGDADCIVEQVSTTEFNVECADVRNATLAYTFVYVDQTDTDETIGVEFTIILRDYTFVSSDANASLVFEQSLSDCSVERESNDDDDDEDGDDDDDDDDEDGDDDDNDTGAGDELRRRLGDDEDDDDDDDNDDDDDQDSDSNDESAGVSSDDSKEFDLDAAVFRLTSGTATCTDSAGAVEDLEVQLVYEKDDEELLIVVPRFSAECVEFVLDPLCAIDLTHLLSGCNAVKSIVAVMFMSFVAVFWI